MTNDALAASKQVNSLMSSEKAPSCELGWDLTLQVFDSKDCGKLPVKWQKECEARRENHYETMQDILFKAGKGIKKRCQQEVTRKFPKMKAEEQKKLLALGQRSIDFMVPFTNGSMVTSKRLKQAIDECKKQPKSKRTICMNLLKSVSKRKGKVNYTTNAGLAAFHTLSSQM